MRKAFTLAEVKRMFPLPLRERVRVRGKKAAFTLAEVLITLGVIGVVSAMTLPTVVKKYQQHVAVNQLKKAYSTLGQVIQLSEAQNGEIATWDFTNRNSTSGAFATYIFPYMKVLKSCKNCHVDYTVKTFDGGTCDRNFYICKTTNNSNLVYMTDGMIFTFENAGYASGYYEEDKAIPYMTTHVDVNGSKKPNQYGKDIFVLEISPKYGVRPYGYGLVGSSYNRWGFSYNNSGGVYVHRCVKGVKYGFYCAAKIISDGWKMADDYPW